MKKTLLTIFVLLVSLQLMAADNFPTQNTLSLAMKVLMDEIQTGVSKAGLPKTTHNEDTDILKVLRNRALDINAKLEKKGRFSSYSQKTNINGDDSQSASLIIKRADQSLEINTVNEKKILITRLNEDELEIKTGKKVLTISDLEVSKLDHKKIRTDAGKMIAQSLGIKVLHHNNPVNKIIITKEDAKSAVDNILARGVVSQEIGEKLAGMLAGGVGYAFGYIAVTNPLAYVFMMTVGAADSNISSMRDFLTYLTMPAIMIEESIMSIFSDKHSTTDIQRHYAENIAIDNLNQILATKEVRDPSKIENTLFEETFGRITTIKIGAKGVTKFFASYNPVENRAIFFHLEKRVDKDGDIVPVYVAYPHKKLLTMIDEPLKLLTVISFEK